MLENIFARNAMVRRFANINYKDIVAKLVQTQLRLVYKVGLSIRKNQIKNITGLM